MDTDLLFHYWTLNEQYSEEPYPSLDSRTDIDQDVDARNHLFVCLTQIENKSAGR